MSVHLHLYVNTDVNPKPVHPDRAHNMLLEP